MTALKVTAIPAFEDNYIWLIHTPDAQQVVAVDPGDAEPVLQYLQAQQRVLSGMLLTHADHVAGVEPLLARFAVPVFGPLGEATPGHPHRVSQGERVEFPALQLAFEVLEVPGHTAGHIAYLGHGAVFCGDTLFSAGCGRLFDGTATQLTESLKKLAALPGSTAVYCGHEYTLSNLRFAQVLEPDNQAIGEHVRRCTALRKAGQPTLPSSIRQERLINPFLRLQEQSVKQAAEAHAGRRLDSDSEIFAVLRDWKNHFRG